ncbi:hypothetical protein AB0P02_28290 [Streptomyces griseoluteus]|uniref:hypothetical protein n=1 Tax=Streptomyces griseoluteus TaxID=29306 RepID=UPI00341C13F3
MRCTSPCTKTASTVRINGRHGCAGPSSRRREAAELLPEAVGASAGLSWAAPPTTELRITCEQPANNGVLPGLDTLVDLTVLGTSDRGPRPQLAVTVTAAPAMGHQTRQSTLREALVYMAREFGYIDAEADLL